MSTLPVSFATTRPVAFATTRPVAFSTTRHVHDTCLCLHTQRAARRLARRFDLALRPFGLTNGQFSLMMSLNRPAPPLIGQVAELLAMDRTTMTAALKPLDRRGLVSVVPDERDRRGRRLALTEAGQLLLAEAVEVWRREHEAIEASLSPGEPSAVRAGLAALG